MTVMGRILATLAVVVAGTQVAYGQSPQAADQNKTMNLSAYAELLRSDIRTQKVAIITEVMGFSDAEDAAFWPIYREYDNQMASLGDERVAMIEEYARNYDQMTDAVADKLAAKAIDIDARRRAALGNCYERVKKATSAQTALRFLQVEHQLQLLIDLQIASALPIAAKRSGS